MRLPYLQIATDLIEHAPDLAVELGISEDKAGWGLVRLIQWALSRCPDDAPPSSSAVVPGAAAPKLIARAAGYRGDPDRFIEACSSLKPKPILERVEGGIRVRGLDRYDEAWRTSQSRSAKAKKAAEVRWGTKEQPKPASPANAPPMLGGCSDDAPRLPQYAQTQTHTQIETQKDSKAEASPPPPEKSTAQPPTDGARAEALAFFEHLQRERHATLRESPQALTSDRDTESWVRGYAAVVKASLAANVLPAAVASEFLCDEWSQQRAPPCPWQAFISQTVIERCVSRAVTLAGMSKKGRSRPIAVAQPGTAAGKRWGEVLERVQADGKTYAHSFLAKLAPVGLGDGGLALQASDPYMREWVTAHYGEYLAGLLPEGFSIVTPEGA